MNYKHYFPRASKLEARLFEEGYWKVSFVAPEKIHNDNSGETPIVTTGAKWRKMMAILFFEKEGFLIKEEEIEAYLNNPNALKYKKINKKILTDKRVAHYKLTKDRIKEPDTEGDS